MKKYIDADLCGQYFYEYMDDKNMIMALIAINDMPSADVQEVRHGRWIDVEPAPHNLFYATCSVCGDRQTIEVANYCPMCGANLRKEENK